MTLRISSELRERPCKVCGKGYLPLRPLQAVCSPRCAAKKVAADAKADREETKRRREAIKTIPDLIRDAQTAFNAYIRERDKGQPCICCGRFPISDGGGGHVWDAGHYRSTGSASHLRFNEDNVHRQLVVCNRHGAGRAVDYRIGLISRIGVERVEALETDNAVHRWTREELVQIKETYRRKLRELKKGEAK